MRPTFYPSTIERVEDLGPGVRAFWCAVPAGFSWEPGAHAHVGLPGFQEGGKPHRELVHNMSIFTLPREGQVAFATRLDRSGSEYKRVLAGLGAGDAATFFREGCGLQLLRDGRPVALLSQGLGLSPLRPLLLAAAEDGAGIPQLTSINVRDAEESFFAADLAPLADSGIELVHVRHRDAFEAAVRTLPEPVATAFTVVGSDEFVRSTIALLRALGVADAAIAVDRNETHRAPLFA